MCLVSHWRCSVLLALLGTSQSWGVRGAAGWQCWWHSCCVGLGVPGFGQTSGSVSDRGARAASGTWAGRKHSCAISLFACQCLGQDRGVPHPQRDTKVSSGHSLGNLTSPRPSLGSGVNLNHLCEAEVFWRDGKGFRDQLQW